MHTEKFRIVSGNIVTEALEILYSAEEEDEARRLTDDWLQAHLDGWGDVWCFSRPGTVVKIVTTK